MDKSKKSYIWLSDLAVTQHLYHIGVCCWTGSRQTECFRQTTSIAFIILSPIIVGIKVCERVVVSQEVTHKQRNNWVFQKIISQISQKAAYLFLCINAT